MRVNTYDYVGPENKRCTKEVQTGELTPHRGGWYYLTMSYRVTGHSPDDPTLYRIAYIRGRCSTLLRETRRKVGFSQRALSAASGVSLSTVAKAEQGRQNLSMDTLAKLMYAMGLRIGLVTYTPGSSVFNTAERLLGIDPRDTVEEEEDDPPDPADKTEQELNEDIDRILEEVPL
jgi:transcriptional regulator with XRE-family HTH domain